MKYQIIYNAYITVLDESLDQLTVNLSSISAMFSQIPYFFTHSLFENVPLDTYL